MAISASSQKCEVVLLEKRRQIVSTIFWCLVSLMVIVPVGSWTTLALWYRIPGPQWFRVIAAAAFLIITGATIVSPMLGRRTQALGFFATAFGFVLIWWVTIKPADSENWAPDVARQTTGSLNADILTLTDVRDFEWTSDTVFTQRWTTQSFDLGKLRTLDLFLSYWAGPEMAHVIMSFGFEGGD